MAINQRKAPKSMQEMNKQVTSRYVDIDRNKRFLKAYQEIVAAITSTLALNRCMQLIVEKIVETMGVKGATVHLFDDSAKKLALYAAEGLSDAYLEKGPLDTDKTIEDVLLGKAVAIYDATTDSRVLYKDEAKAEGVASILAVPTPIRGRVVGALSLFSDEHRRYDGEDISFVTSIAEQCGIAIDNAKLYENQIQQVRYLDALHEVTKAVNSTLNLDDVLDIIVCRIPDIMKVDAVTIRLLDDQKKNLELVAASGLSQHYLLRGSIEAEKNIQMVLKGKPVAIYDATVDPAIQYRREAKEEGIGSILAVPIITEDEVIGVMRLLCKVNRHFSESEINFSVAVAEKCGIAIHNARMYQQISSLLDEIKQLDKAKSSFMQIVAHELKSPVAVIQTLLMTIVNTYENNLEVPVMDLLNRAINRCAGMVDLTRDLIDYSRLKHLMPKEESREEVDFVDLAKRRILSFIPVAEQKEIVIRYDLLPELPSLFGRRDELGQVVDNLLSNAVRYTPSGGRVGVSIEKEDDQLVFQVRDTGIGIPKKDVPKLFDEFYRSSNAKEFVTIGSGLGLSIVKNIVDKMFGKIEIKTQEEKGTSFTIRFPIDNRR